MSNVKKVEIIEDYDGPVYDLQVAQDESFVVNGIVVHNCTMIPVVPGFAPLQYKTGEEWFDEQPESVQKAMMGPGRFRLWQAGKFKFSQLATSTPNEKWGPSLRVTSIKNLMDGKGGYTPPKPKKTYQKKTKPVAPAPPPPLQPPPPPPFPSLTGETVLPSPLPALDHDALLKIDMHQVGPDWGFQTAWKNSLTVG